MSRHMKTTKRRQPDTDGEPLKKVPRVSLRKISNCQPGKKVTVPTLELCQLPNELLLKIFGYINMWHFPKIRATCKRIHDLVDMFVMHEFLKASHYQVEDNRSSYNSAVLRCIKVATDAYIRSGFQSTFCDCMVTLLHNSYKKPFCPTIGQVQKFLQMFYCIVENRMHDDLTSQKSRILYTITVIRFLKAFQSTKILSSKTESLHWRVVIELNGPWLGTLWTTTNKACFQPTQWHHFLIILATILISDITDQAFRRVWECSNEIYVFGNDVGKNKRTPRTQITLTIHGSKKICTIFRNCVEMDLDNFQWPDKWPKNQFTVNINIKCKEALKWGCHQSQYIELSPFSKASYNEYKDDNTDDDST